jgi:hypothetical protein
MGHGGRGRESDIWKLRAMDMDIVEEAPEPAVQDSADLSPRSHPAPRRRISNGHFTAIVFLLIDLC